MLIRNSVILGLVLLGVLLLWHWSRDEATIAWGCFLIALIYALLTGRRSWL
jgi:hypothetical protein